MRLAISDWLRTLAVTAALGGALAPNLALQGDELVPRSLANWRQRQVDRLRLPRYEDGPSIRRTEQGWLVQSAQYAVVARTRADAEWAAGQVGDTWASMGRLASHWTRVHEQPNFALNAIQIVVSDPHQMRVFDDARRGPDGPEHLPVVQYDGGQMLIRIVKDAADETNFEPNSAPNSETSATATAQLRHAVAHSFLHAGQFDRTFPDWVCEGLARYATRQGLEAEDADLAMQNLRMPRPPRGRIVGSASVQFNGQLGQNGGQFDQGGGPAIKTADIVSFLLEGDDASHAGSLFGALLRTTEQARIAPAERVALTGPGPGRVPVDSESLDQLAMENVEAFERWSEDPLVGQPRLVDTEKLGKQLEPLERQLAFVLKLLQRFGQTPRNRTRVKVQEFGRSEAKAIPAVVTSHATDLRRLYDRLMREDEFWATLGPEGKLLLSSDRERIAEALDVLRNSRLAAQRTLDTWQVSYRLGDGRNVTARWEHAKAAADRPKIRFELPEVSPRRYANDFESPAAESEAPSRDGELPSSDGGLREAGN